MTHGPFTLPRLPARDLSGHKGTFGTVAVVGGCCHGGVMMVGAPAIAARAALRAGCGLARLAMPEPILAAGLTITPSATGRAITVSSNGEFAGHEAAIVMDELCANCDALVVGPGLGAGEGTRAIALRAVGQQEVPVVVDADALNALSDVRDLFRDFKARAVLTPHPGEYRRLARALGISRDPVDPATREIACIELAQRLGAVVVLKGAKTVVSDGHRVWTCGHTDSALATAGTGDVLAGLIGSLLAQHAKPPAEPDLHALAMQRLAEKAPKLAAQVREQTHVIHDPLEAPGRRANEPQPNAGTLDLFALACIGVEAHARAAAAWRAKSHADSGLLAMELADELSAVLTQMRG